MSEYQFYEFRAVDRNLTDEEMADLRALSTRATITPTSFQNVYNYGDFRGDPLELMQRYFDAFVYVANWGTRQFMLRLPATLLPRDVADRYAVEQGVEVHPGGDQVIVELAVNEEDSEWEWGEGNGWLDTLLPLREEIARGDLRALYLGWLSTLWLTEEEEGELEQRERARAAQERERRLREAAAAREAQLQDLAGRQEEIWRRIETLLEVRRGPEYDQAASYLVNLREVAQREGTMPAFTVRVQDLRARHASRPAFIRRLDAAELS